MREATKLCGAAAAHLLSGEVAVGTERLSLILLNRCCHSAALRRLWAGPECQSFPQAGGQLRQRWACSVAIQGSTTGQQRVTFKL